LAVFLAGVSVERSALTAALLVLFAVAEGGEVPGGVVGVAGAANAAGGLIGVHVFDLVHSLGGLAVGGGEVVDLGFQ